MTTRRAPRRKVAPSQLSAIVVLALGAWMHPALSATGANTRCDQSMDGPPMSAAADSKLAIQVIDHGTGAAEEISLEETATDLPPESSHRLAGPRVDTMLRRVIDDAQLRQPQLSEPAQSDSISGPSEVENAEAANEPAAMISTEQPDDTAGLTEFSAEEFLRYRKQMFRKDI